jgi:hypothetical protein
MDKVTVGFVTKSKEWVTADIEQAFATFFTGQYKPGEKVRSTTPFKFFR